MKELMPLAAVAFMPPYPNPAPTDTQGELTWIDLRDLFIDPRYQRPIGARGEKNIRQVIENFSWSLFSPIVVCKRDKGCYAIIDGQHRAIAALTHGGIEKIPALVINGDENDEAKAFAVINGAVTAIMPTQIWHARVMAGEYNAIVLQRIFDEFGVTILKSAKSMDNIQPGETISIDAMEDALDRYGPDIFKLMLATILRTGKGNPGYLRTQVIRATCMVFSKHPEWVRQPEAVIRAIKTCGIKYLWARAEHIKVGPPKVSSAAAYSQCLTELFTKELTNAK